LRLAADLPESRRTKAVAGAKGLYIRLHRNSQQWLLRYQFECKARVLVLGYFPELTLAAARAQAVRARAFLDDGKDPAERRRALVAAQADGIAARRTMVAGITEGRFSRKPPRKMLEIKEAVAEGAILKKQRRTQAERRAASEQRIINTALRLIARKGTVRLTLTDVGEESGYSRGLPVHLFGNKEALLEHVMDRFVATETNNVLREWVPGQGLEALRAETQRWSESCGRDPARFRTYQVLLGEAACEDLEGTGAKLFACLQAVNRQMRQQLQRLLEQGKAAGDIAADVDPFQTALQINSMLRGLISVWVLDPKGIDLAAATRHYLHHLIARLRPRTLPKTRKQMRA
jgi:AcrR family transcriptional regulator